MGDFFFKFCGLPTIFLTLPFLSLLLLGQPFTLNRNNPVMIVPISIRILTLHFCINLLLMSNHITIVLYATSQLVCSFISLLFICIYIKDHWFLIIGTFKHSLSQNRIYFFIISSVWSCGVAPVPELGWDEIHGPSCNLGISYWLNFLQQICLRFQPFPSWLNPNT